MNKIRFSLFLAGAALAVAIGGLHAQTSIQQLTFSLIGQYQTNILTTNGAIKTTNEDLIIRPILITTANVVKSIALDLEGTNWDVQGPTSTNWIGATLVREVNLTDGAEGIFLRKGTNQVNVSDKFDTSFTNNFTGYLSNYMMLVTNNLGTNTFTNDAITNPFPMNAALTNGWIYAVGATNTTSNVLTSAGLYTVSFFTSNIQFNAFGIGTGGIANVYGRLGGTNYQSSVYSEAIGIVGAFNLNTTSNIFDLGTNSTNAPIYVSGPLHGGITTGAGTFSTIPGP